MPASASAPRAITVVGSVNVDLVARVDAHPEPGETTIASGFAIHNGGKGANQAVAAARLDAPVRFVASVGDDDHGRRLSRALSQEGIDVTQVKTSSGTSGMALITVDRRGENRIVVISGANAELSPSDLTDTTFAAPGIALFQRELPEPFTARAIACAKDAGLETILNAAPARNTDLSMLANVDWLVVNAGEAAMLSSQDIPEDFDDALVCARRLTGYGPGVVLTLGRLGALLLEPNGHQSRVDAVASQVVDTTGAGDAFVGAFASARLAWLEPAEAVRNAVASGALAVQRAGAQPSLAYKHELDAFKAGDFSTGLR